MSEAKTANKKSLAKPSGLLGTTTAGLITTGFIMIVAWCFLGSVWGIQSMDRKSAAISLQQIDTLLALKTWISPPGWIHKITDFYTHWRTVTAQSSTDCFSQRRDLSQNLAGFQMPLIAAADNSFTQGLSHSCSVVKIQVLPLLSGAAAVVALRCWGLITALPLFLLSLSVGLVDGLVQRDIRKFQAVRESTLLFHRIKRCGAAIFFLPLFAYFAWLSPVSPLWFFIPMAVALGLWLALSLRFFKKYI